MRYLLLLLISLNASAAGKIINADIAASGTANIARNKLAASTAHNACTFDASGYIAGGVAPGTSGNILTSNGTDWTSAATTAALSVGAFSAVPTAQGLTLSSNVLNMDPADNAHPGGVSTGAQTFAGVKTFSSTITGTTSGNEVPLTFTSPIIRTVNTITCQSATGAVPGCLSAADWTTFNGKQAAGNYITGITGDLVATGPGSVNGTLATVNSNVGTFANATVTVNAKGLVTAVSSGSASGACAAPVLTETTSYVLLTADFTCANKIINIEMNCSSDCTLTLPAATNTSYEARIINIGTAQATVSTAGSDTFGTSAATTWVMQASPAAPQTGNLFWANGGTRWNGQ